MRDAVADGSRNILTIFQWRCFSNHCILFQSITGEGVLPFLFVKHQSTRSKRASIDVVVARSVGFSCRRPIAFGRWDSSGGEAMIRRVSVVSRVASDCLGHTLIQVTWFTSFHNHCTVDDMVIQIESTRVSFLFSAIRNCSSLLDRSICRSPSCCVTDFL